MSADDALARLEDLERAGLDLCRELRALVLEAEHERAILIARLDEARRLFAYVTPSQRPPLVQQPDGEGPIPRPRVTATCSDCQAPFLASTRHARRCPTCNRQQQAARMTQWHADAKRGTGNGNGSNV